MSHEINATATTRDYNNSTQTQQNGSLRLIWWRNPYFLGSISILIIASLALTLSLLLICRKLHHMHHCSLFLVEMAVGCLTTEAITQLLPALIVTQKERTSSGMPVFFPRVITVTAGVCLLHALDTASIVFFGRRQSTSHAMELREEDDTVNPANHHQQLQQQRQEADKVGAINHEFQGVNSLTELKRATTEDQASIDTMQLSEIEEAEAFEDGEGGSSSSETITEFEKRIRLKAVLDGNRYGDSIRFEDDSTSYNLRRRRGAIRSETLGEMFSNPRLFLQPGPYRLCSILSAGSILHSFADGIAIGAAFVKGWESGLHLSLSVGMHELAHKVADFSVLTASGFSVAVVILLNCVYWAAALVGLFVSVPLSQSSEPVRVWITTLSTAVYVYISLVTMSSMVRKNYLPQQISAFIIGNVGMTTGFVLIMLSSVLEFNYAA